MLMFLLFGRLIQVVWAVNIHNYTFEGEGEFVSAIEWAPRSVRNIVETIKWGFFPPTHMGSELMRRPFEPVGTSLLSPVFRT